MDFRSGAAILPTGGFYSPYVLFFLLQSQIFMLTFAARKKIFRVIHFNRWESPSPHERWGLPPLHQRRSLFSELRRRRSYQSLEQQQYGHGGLPSSAVRSYLIFEVSPMSSHLRTGQWVSLFEWGNSHKTKAHSSNLMSSLD